MCGMNMVYSFSLTHTLAVPPQAHVFDELAIIPIRSESEEPRASLLDRVPHYPTPGKSRG